MNSPHPGRNIFTIRQKIAIPICIEGMAAWQAFEDLLFCTTTVVVGAGAGAITTVVLFDTAAIF